MSQPFIFIGTYGVKEGKRDEYEKRLRDLVKLVESSEPRLIAFNAYLSEDGRKTSIVQVHPDSESMEFHMQVVADHIEDSAEFLEWNGSHQVFGTPTAGLRAGLEEQSSAEMPLTMLPVPAGGFTRASVD